MKPKKDFGIEIVMNIRLDIRAMKRDIRDCLGKIREVNCGRERIARRSHDTAGTIHAERDRGRCPKLFAEVEKLRAEQEQLRSDIQFLKEVSSTRITEVEERLRGIEVSRAIRWIPTDL